MTIAKDIGPGEHTEEMSLFLTGGTGFFGRSILRRITAFGGRINDHDLFTLVLGKINIGSVEATYFKIVDRTAGQRGC